jgi:hypothetical protein
LFLGSYKISTKIEIAKVKDLSNVHIPTAPLGITVKKGENGYDFFYFIYFLSHCYYYVDVYDTHNNNIIFFC